MKRLDGRVAVVTGAGSGIGRATSLALAERGCSIAVVDVQPDGAEETAEHVRSLGTRASVHLADVRDPARIDELPAEVEDSLGPCHILVNNAGVTAAGAFADEAIGDLRWIVDINVWGVVHGCRAFLPMLREADEAHIVNMSSMVGLLGLPHNVSYARRAPTRWCSTTDRSSASTSTGPALTWSISMRTSPLSRVSG